MRLLKIFLFSLMLVIGARLLYLNYAKESYYETKFLSEMNRYVYGPSAPRGRILDVNGKVLVDNKGLKAIFYHHINDVKDLDVADKLSNLLSIEEEITTDIIKEYYLEKYYKKCSSLISKKEYDLYKNRKLSDNDLKKLKLNRITDKDLSLLSDNETKASYIYHLMKQGYSYENKLIKKGISEKEYARVIEANIPGVFGDILWERYYPYSDVLKSILGTIGNISKENAHNYLKRGYELSDIVGISYLEFQYEDYLKGSKAKYQVLPNNTLKMIKEVKRGNDIVLNINIDYQLKLEQVLKDNIIKAKHEPNTSYYKESYVVLSNPNTGAIVALSGQRYLKDHTFQDVTNNIINNSYTVGSVVKGATITVGYNNNIINENTMVNDSCIKLYLVPQKCSYKRLGRLNDINALKESSNYFQFLIAIGLTGQKYSYNMKLDVSKTHFDIYRNTLADYGLGVLSGIDLPNEKLGIKGNIISGDLLLNLAIGQYDTYTPIMLSTYINTIAAKGFVHKPMLLNSVIFDSKVLKNDNDLVRKVAIEDKYLDRIRTGFNLVTTKGTARGYFPNTISSAGKTGTSESFYDSDNDGIYESKTITTTFAGFFPYDNPKYSIIIVSPNVSNYQDNDEYISRVNRYISKDMSEFIINN